MFYLQTKYKAQMESTVSNQLLVYCNAGGIKNR